MRIEAGCRRVKADTGLKWVGWCREKLVPVKMMESTVEGKRTKIKTTVIKIT